MMWWSIYYEYYDYEISELVKKIQLMPSGPQAYISAMDAWLGPCPWRPYNHSYLTHWVKYYDFGTSKVVGRQQEHIKLELVDSNSNNVMNGIAFGQSESVRYIKSKRSFSIAYTIEDNVYKHNDIQLQIEDIRPAEGEVENEGL